MLEHRRQRSMLFILAFNYALWLGLFGLLFLMLEAILGTPQTSELMGAQLETLGMSLETLVYTSVTTFASLLMTNLPLFVAIMTATSVLHDRSCGTMPFLMLAPITRQELLLGKLVGAMAIPCVLHLVFVGAGCAPLGRLEVLAPQRDVLGGSAAFWVALVFGAPAAAALVGALGTVISALSRDTRTSIQFTNFFIGLLSLGFSFALVHGIPQGVALQVAFASGCIFVAALVLLFGAHLISSDV